MPKFWGTEKVCKFEGCNTSYLSVSKWDEIRAHDEGWFLQRNGDVWCPEHTPEWVQEWRARKRT